MHKYLKKDDYITVLGFLMYRPKLPFEIIDISAGIVI